MNRWEHCLTYSVLILKKFGVFIVYGQPEVDEPYTTMASMEIPLFVVFTRQPLQRQRSVGRLRSPTAARRLNSGFQSGYLMLTHLCLRGLQEIVVRICIFLRITLLLRMTLQNILRRIIGYVLTIILPSNIFPFLYFAWKISTNSSGYL